MALIKCKECGNDISSQAETCPKCGLRLKASPQAKAGSGCIVGLFKLIGGLVGAVIGLMVAVSLLSNSKSATPTRKLEIGCDEFSKTLPEGAERRAAYQNCIGSGSSVIRAQERINAEGGQTFKPDTVGGSELKPSSSAPSSPQDRVLSVSEVPPTATSLTPTQVSEVAAPTTPSQSSPEQADSANAPSNQLDKGN